MNSSISSLFTEYLEYYDFKSTLLVYKKEYENRYSREEREEEEEGKEEDGKDGNRKETRNKKDNVNDNINGDKDNEQSELRINIINKLLHLFNDGNTDEFFTIWKKYIKNENNNAINNTTSTSISEYKSIEFYLHVYFSIYPLLDRNQINNENIINEMNKLKLYIELNGNSISTSEYLPYFALPYVPAELLYEHNTFKNLFQSEWIDKLRYRYEEFINDNITLPPLPKIYDLINNSNKSNSLNSDNNYEKDHQILELHSHLDISSKKIESLMLLLKDISLCVYEVSVQLVELIEYTDNLNLDPSHRSNMIMHANRYINILSFWNTLSNSSKEFLESVLNESNNLPDDAATLPQLPEINSHDIISEAPSNAGGQHLQINSIEVKDDQLNFSALISSLATINDEFQIALLLQSLRFRLSCTSNANARREVLNLFIKNDLLNCSHTRKVGDLLAKFVLTNNVHLRESICRFLNTIATDSNGRIYLLQQANVIKVLFAVLKTELGDTASRQNALGVLQKFSLRRSPQTQLIQIGMMEWIVSQMKLIDSKTYESPSLSLYTVEYISALLMNLSLRVLGKKRCEKFTILPVLVNMLLHPNLQVRTYINGTLYSILSREKVRINGISLNIASSLIFAKTRSEEPFTQQIDFILAQLTDITTNSDEEDDHLIHQEEQEPDDDEDPIGDDEVQLDEEIDELSSINIDQPRGDKLLERYMKESISNTATWNGEILNSVPNNNTKEKPILRPTTPNSGRNVSAEHPFGTSTKVTRTPRIGGINPNLQSKQPTDISKKGINVHAPPNLDLKSEVIPEFEPKRNLMRTPVHR